MFQNTVFKGIYAKKPVWFFSQHTDNLKRSLHFVIFEEIIMKDKVHTGASDKILKIKTNKTTTQS